MVVWITGAKGFIGQHLSRHLVRCGHSVLGLGHGLWPKAGAEAGLRHWVNGEITASNLNSLLMASGRPDFVVHLAGGSSVGTALVSPREDFCRTVVTTAELLEWLRKESPDTRLVAISSAAVYGSGHDCHIAEISATRPISPYGHHKLMMEQLCRSYGSCYGLSSTVLRLFSVYGSGLHKQLLWDLCWRLSAEPAYVELGGSGEELRDWIHVTDVLRAVDLVAPRASPDVPTFNVGTGHGTSVKDIAQMVIEGFAIDGVLSELRFSGDARPGDPFSLVADPVCLRALGFECRVSLKQGICDYVDWFRGLGGIGALR